MSSSCVVEAYRQRVAAEHTFLTKITEHEATSGWRDAGASSYAAWLARQCNEPYAAARQWIRDAHALAGHRTLDAAYSAGEISTAQMRAISTLARPETDDDEVWLELIQTPDWDLHALQREARRQTARELEHTDRGTYLAFEASADEQLMRGSFQLPFEDGAILMHQVDRLIPRGTPLQLLARARAEALTELTRTAPGRANLTIRINADDPVGQAERGGFLSQATVERLACDAKVRPIIEQNGKPVGIGRASRLVPKWLADLVWERDKCCTHPYCDRTDFVDIHHVTHWFGENGPTELWNLILACTSHHNLIHEHGWRLEGEAGPNITWIRPDGVTLTRTPAPLDTS